MPPHSYHLKFELYPRPDPLARSPTVNTDDDEQHDPIWVPPAGSSLFDNLPSHPRRQQTLDPAERRRQRQKSLKQPATEPIPLDLRTVPQRPSPAVIDCDPSSRLPQLFTEEEDRTFTHISERQWRSLSSSSLSAPSFTNGLGPSKAGQDWRFGRVNIESYDLFDHNERQPRENSADGQVAADNMTSATSAGNNGSAIPAASLGPTLGGAGQSTRARYVQLETKNTEVGWGIVHLYRETDELHALSAPATDGEGEVAVDGGSEEGQDCTILCIPAVPSYLSPSDFLGFVGEDWRGDVSHYRMVMTSRLNRYMVLMKFRDSKRAREWRKAFDGKVFNSIEAEVCHVTFIKSITVETPSQPPSYFTEASSSSSVVANSLRPFPPPTPNLIELPTCPVCLERMDDTAGLMTILCQHVFHCTCLQTWKGSGCPVCRATNPSLPSASEYDPSNPYTQPFGAGISNLCSVCDCPDDLWICLICGYVGCGRYKNGHAKEHWKETAHSFSLELETQHVWDYAGDMWVHRLIRDKGDGKVVELPSNSTRQMAGNSQGSDEDVVPRAKLDQIGMEYTQLMTSQLESQRVYFEEMVNKAADKASKASATAERAAAQAQEALRENAELRERQRMLEKDTVPTLERDLERERVQAAKSKELARNLGRSLQEEKKVSEGLLERIRHVNAELESLRLEMEKQRAEAVDLRETNRDLSMFISGQEKLRELQNEGKIAEGELVEGTASVPEKKGKGKGKGRAKK